MKHYITISVIAAAALASCTQTEDFTSQYNEKAKTMKFDVAYVGKNTRATGDLTTANLGQKLILWCDAYQTPTAPETTPSNGMWISTHEPLYLSKSNATYWNVYKEASASTSADVNYPGSTYTTYFTAIAPQDEFETTPTGEGTATKATYSMGNQYTDGNSAPEFDKRLLTLDNIPVVQVVSNEGTKKGIDYLITCAKSTSEEVSLPFKHLLSKLRFAVWTDENTATDENPTTKIELNSLKVYLPKNVTAKYEQTKHDDVKGTWTWSGYTAPTEENPTELPNYTEYSLFDEGSTPNPMNISYFNGPTSAHGDSNWDNVKLSGEPCFFIAPTGTNTGLKLYIDIIYTVKRKIEPDSEGNATWSTTSEPGQQGYHVGHKVVERTKMLVPVGDGSLGHGNDTDADAERNEGLSHFHQGTLETLYICLRADQLVKFDTTFDVNGWYVDKWQDDPIDINQK